ncbi:unnamed protein product (macronuclear) [Paramecium tetraurelia]|uniref:Phospholipase A-2-activating protein n=1 Tax=Paramecium tetraurelia TaxID=5888 RepID=A0C8R3_PARTE|nr:uncharacterized protein GSPATT00036315001 [Paramecium tetraurelia]CAK67180.1 unnamed protein product [Paramecium tetraurelia]|eukprot:XP_001434577.1 hypothetical protein (macronuclear) [Paramecium tetraurelia strain d4-2]
MEASQYKLSQTIAAHNGIVRSTSIQGDQLLTCSGDKTAKLYELKDNQYQQVTLISFFEKFIYASCARVNGGYAVGQDKQIYLLDNEGNLLGILDGHEQQVCSLKSISKDLLISGSWDATAIIWDISQMKQLYRLSGHKYGVAVYGDENLNVLTGSQDGVLHSWSKETKIKSVEAHEDIIREILPSPFGGYLTCSNDETIKLWSKDLELIQTFLGHKSFVFTMKYHMDQVISGGEDRLVIIWNLDGTSKQTIQLPDTVWTVTINNNNDIVVGTADGKVRVFTSDPARYSSQKEIEELKQEQASLSNAKQEGAISEEEVQKLPGIDKLTMMAGKNDGEVRLFLNGDKPQAYIWSAANKNWQMIGGEESSQKKIFYGDKYFEAGEYDHIFDVEDGNGIAKLMPYNEGENLYVTAEKFCLREGYSKNYIQQIVEFLKYHTSFGQSQRQKKQELETMNEQQYDQEQILQQEQAKNQLDYQYIPYTKCTYYENMNLQGLSQKLFEFNALMSEELRLTENETLIFNKGIDNLGQISMQKAVDIENSVSLIFVEKLLKWDAQYLSPVYDFFRIFSLHHSSEQLFADQEKGMSLFLNIVTIANIQPPNAVLIGLALQTLCNCLKHNTNSCAILYHLRIVKDIIQSLLDTDEDTVHLLSNLILNLSIGIYQGNELIDKASEILSESIVTFLQYKQRDAETIAKLVTALGNLLRSPAQQIREQCKKISYGFIQSLMIDTNNQDTLKCLEDVKLSMQI